MLRHFNFSGRDKLILIMDITSLFTVIPNGEGLRALKHFLINALSKNQGRKRYSALIN